MKRVGPAGPVARQVVREARFGRGRPRLLAITGSVGRVIGKVSRAGAATTGSQVVAVDGNPPRRVVIYVYPNMEALRAWRNDPAYVQVRAVGEKYATYHTFAVEGAAAN